MSRAHGSRVRWALGGASGPCVVFKTEHRVGPMNTAAINGTGLSTRGVQRCAATPWAGHPRSAPILPGLFADLAETRTRTGGILSRLICRDGRPKSHCALGELPSLPRRDGMRQATLGVFRGRSGVRADGGMPVEKTARALALAATFSYAVEGELRNDDETAACGCRRRATGDGRHCWRRKILPGTPMRSSASESLQVLNRRGNCCLLSRSSGDGGRQLGHRGCQFDHQAVCAAAGGGRPAIDAMLMLVRENDLSRRWWKKIESQTPIGGGWGLPISQILGGRWMQKIAVCGPCLQALVSRAYADRALRGR